ncbi:MAG: hypothetical protein ACREQ5_01365 [Candidatus Dormibacteria bacterium]
MGSVHVGEVHTDVIPSASAGATPPVAAKHEHLGAREEQWQESRCHAEWLHARVAAEGLDD